MGTTALADRISHEETLTSEIRYINQLIAEIRRGCKLRSSDRVSITLTEKGKAKISKGLPLKLKVGPDYVLVIYLQPPVSPPSREYYNKHGLRLSKLEPSPDGYL